MINYYNLTHSFFNPSLNVRWINKKFHHPNQDGRQEGTLLTMVREFNSIQIWSSVRNDDWHKKKVNARHLSRANELGFFKCRRYKLLSLSLPLMKRPSTSLSDKLYWDFKAKIISIKDLLYTPSFSWLWSSK